MNNLVKRTLFGTLFAVIFVLTALHPISYLVIFLFFVGAAIRELDLLLHIFDDSKLMRWLNVAGGCYLFFISYCIFSNYDFFKSADPLLYFLPYILYLLYLFVSRLFLTDYKKAYESLAGGLFSQVYIAGSFSLLNKIVFQPDLSGSSYYSPLFLIAILISVWVNDSGAFLIGSWIGKHPLSSNISPKKTKEGFWGGIIFSVLSMLVFSLIYQGIPMLIWLGFGLVIAFMAVLGDLFESVLKRMQGVKDSGAFLPGHGGVLDRFDSLLFAIPTAFIYIEVFIRS